MIDKILLTNSFKQDLAFSEKGNERKNLEHLKGMSMIKIYMLLIFMVFLGACSKGEDSADVKYVALEQDKRETDIRGAYNVHNFLIHFIHEPIRIFVIPKKNCKASSDNVKRSDPEVQAFVRSAYSQWIDGVQKAIDTGQVIIDKPLVKDVEFTYKRPHLVIFFNCDFGSVYYTQDRSGEPRIHLSYRKVSDYADGTEFLFNKFSMGSMLHELGHAFGLADTYITKSTSEYNKAIGDNPYRYGRQPTTLMNESYDAPWVGDDEIAGLSWLYRYYIIKDIGINECTVGYKYEEETGGCLPSTDVAPVTYTDTDQDIDPSSDICFAERSANMQMEEKLKILLGCLPENSLGGSLYGICKVLIAQEEVHPLECYEDAYANYLKHNGSIDGGWERYIQRAGLDNQMQFTQVGTEYVLHPDHEKNIYRDFTDNASSDPVPTTSYDPTLFVDYDPLILWDGFQKGRPEKKEDVRKLQRLLKENGASLTIDGFYGEDTSRAVADFQTLYNLTVNGNEVDSETWALLTGGDPEYDSSFDIDVSL